jgi:hypothetical protein
MAGSWPRLVQLAAVMLCMQSAGTEASMFYPARLREAARQNADCPLMADSRTC